MMHSRGTSMPASVVVASILGTAFIVTSLPTVAAVLKGRVTDDSGAVGFKGAEVRVDELGRAVVTDSDGRFRLDGLAPGRYTLIASYVGAIDASQVVDLGADGAAVTLMIGADVARLDNILVVGYAAGQASALSQQRTADNFKNVVSSDAIGQFPDQNVTEAVQRVPGVSITRDQGEGRFIVVRGIDPNLNSISIGGVRVPSAEKDSRQVALDVIPSELLSGIEIDKTLLPDMDGDGIGASINVKTLSAFDRGNKQSASFKLEGGYNEHREKWSPKGSVTWTSVFDVGAGENNLGIAFGGSWQNRFLGTDNLETNGYEEREAPDGSIHWVPKRFEQRAYTVDRRRESAVLNIDWIASGNTTLYLHSLWSDFRDREQRQANRYRFDKGDVVTLDDDGGTFEDGRIEKTVKLREETQRIQSYAIGGETLADLWTVDYEAAWSKADETNPGEIEGTFIGSHDIGLGNALGSTPLAYALDPVGASDPSSYALDKVSISDGDTGDTERSARLDVRRELGFAEGSGFLKFGAKARRRSKFNDEDSLAYDSDSPTLADFYRAHVDYAFGDFGPGWSPQAIRDYVSNGLPGSELNAEDTAIDSIASDYHADEDIDAGYLMAGYDNGPWHWVGGVRLERTRFEASGIQAQFDDDSDEALFNPVRASSDYSDVLPQLGFRYDLGPRTLLRAALTRSVSRANFSDLTPGAEISITRNDDGSIDEREISTGNPFLDPYRADNLDLAWEFYPDGLGAVTAGLFYKHITDFVVRANLAGRDEYADYTFADVPINGDSADLYGLELSWTQQLGWLPAPFDGLFVNANATWADSTANLALREDSIPLPNQSRVLANLVLGYENGPVSLRLSNSFRDKRLTDLDDPEDSGQDIYERSHLQVDFSAKYRLTDGWRLYADAINLTDRPYYRRYAGGGVAQYEKYGRVYQFGIEASF